MAMGQNASPLLCSLHPEALTNYSRVAFSSRENCLRPSDWLQVTGRIFFGPETRPAPMPGNHVEKSQLQQIQDLK